MYTEYCIYTGLVKSEVAGSKMTTYKRKGTHS